MTTTTSMKAVQILGPKTNPTITLNPTHPLPTADTDNDPEDPLILLRVHSAGVTADEQTWPELYSHTNRDRIPGCEVAGTVAALPEGYGISSISSSDRLLLQVGDAVYAMLHPDRARGQAEWTYARVSELARVPRSLLGSGLAMAAALPIPALTAWEGLWKRVPGGLPKGARVLVTGASGAVGRMVVQIAKSEKFEGVRVVALAKGEEKLEAVMALGADEVVDYGLEGWEDLVGRRSVDAVFDAAGGEVLTRAWGTVKDDGVVLTIADPPPAWAVKKVVPKEAEGRPGVRYVYFIVSPDWKGLGEISNLIDEGILKPLPVVEFPLDKAVEAWEFAQHRGRQGKVVINLVSDV
ncbi:NAD(P)-binding protein [Parathielavia appendiculata]|uniref:NAD(P)-binding protein n=1 Tax=Parathielavia appendiculata TaxID=2587402 RepID=A0AAN6Z1B6_9PEZI|nr:NAD(P)-binding protein [Parathielavia appendiculata]